MWIPALSVRFLCWGRVRVTFRLIQTVYLRKGQAGILHSCYILLQCFSACVAVWHRSGEKSMQNDIEEEQMKTHGVKYSLPSSLFLYLASLLTSFLLSFPHPFSYCTFFHCPVILSNIDLHRESQTSCLQNVHSFNVCYRCLKFELKIQYWQYSYRIKYIIK